MTSSSACESAAAGASRRTPQFASVTTNMMKMTPMKGDDPESSVCWVRISLWLSHQLLATTRSRPRVIERQVTPGTRDADAGGVGEGARAGTGRRGLESLPMAVA